MLTVDRGARGAVVLLLLSFTHTNQICWPRGYLSLSKVYEVGTS